LLKAHFYKPVNNQGMKKKILFTTLFTFISISFLFAQDKNLTGHWTGRIMDQYDVATDYVANGDSLTGKSTHYDGSVSDINNGKIMGDSISYDITYNGEIIHVTGKLNHNVLTVYFNYQGNDLSADLKKTIPSEK